MCTLQVRLNDPEYQNWVKAGICLLYTKEGLEDFVNIECQRFHQNVLDNLTRSSIPFTGQPVCAIVINRQRLVNRCHHPYCQAFLNAVMQEGTDPNHPFTPNKGNLANTDVGLWHREPYELAKLFMNPGQLSTQSGPGSTDFSGIVNFMGHCKVPRSQIGNLLLIDEVRRARNVVMHTSDMKVSEPDFQAYSQSMINLLNERNISASPRAQHAVAQIQRDVNAVDFNIYLEDEGKVMTSLTNELRTLTAEIEQKLTEVKDGVEIGNVQVRQELKHSEEELRKVSSLYETLQERVNASSDLHDEMETQLEKLEGSLNITVREHKDLTQRVTDLQANQETFEKQTSHAMSNFAQQQKQTNREVSILQAQQETYITDTNEAIETLKAEQAEYHRKTDEAIDDLRTKDGSTWIPSQKDKAQLRQYLIDGYAEKVDVTLLPDWDELHVSEIFTPAILVGDKNLESYTDMFYNGSKLERRLFLLGEAGMGKTTFSKHLTDAWCSIIADESCKSSLCTPAVLPQFVDIDVLKQFQYLFYVSCRFAGEKESIFDMIDNQLFDDEKMKNVAIYTLKHYPECCLIILDGADEWRGSPTSATGRRGDKAGLPSMAGIEKCVILITSRPWRFHALSTKIQSSFRQLKINGIKNEQELAQRILQKMDNPDPRRSAYMFLLEVGRQNMSALMKIPLMLIIMLGSWEHDKSLHKSMSINYINMIHSFICRSKGLAGWSSSDSKLRRLIPNLNHLETEWEQQANELPEVLSRYKHIRRFAGLFISLGQLAFDLLFGKEEQSLVFSKAVLKSYLRVDDENDEPLNVCLMLGILSKTKTKTRGLKKMESYAFSHKTFQEFFAVLWLASKYAHEKSKLYKNIKNVNDLYEFDTLIRFLCGLCPESGKHFWVFVTEQVTIREGEKEEVQRLICRYIKEQEFDINGPISDQSLFCIPHIKIIPYTSDEDIRLLCGVMEKYPCKVKTLCVNEDHPHSSLSEEQAVRICMSVSSCSSLQTLKLRQLKQSGTNIYKSNCPTLDLQKHHTMETLDLWQLSVKGLELPLEGTRLRSLGLTFLTIPHYSWEALGESVSSYTNLEELNLCYYTCSEHGRCCAIPLLDLQKHKRLEKLRLETISVKGLVLPLEGARFTFLHLKDVTMAQQGYEQLCESLSSCSSLVTLNLWTVTCSEHRFGHCQLVLDLQKHNRLEKLSLRCLPLDGVLLPVKGTRLKELQMYDLRIFHHSLQQLGDVSSWYGLVKIDLYQVSCIQHIHISCLPVLDLHKHSKLVTLRLWNPPGLLIPVEGARLRELSMYKVKMNLHSLEKLWESLSSCVSLERLRLMEVFFSADKAGCSPPLLDLQNHNALEKLELWDLSIEGLLLPLAGTRIKSLQLGKVSMAHNRLDQLGQVLSSCSAIHQLELEDVTCREHLNSCQPVRDLQNIYRGW